MYGYSLYFFAPNGSVEAEFYTFANWWDFVLMKFIWYSWIYLFGWINILIPVTNFGMMPLLMWLALLNHNLEDSVVESQ